MALVLVGLLLLSQELSPPELRFTTSEVQAHIDRKMPFREPGAEPSYELSAVRITLGADHRMGFEAALRGDVLGRTVQGTVRGGCEVSYRDGSVYLRRVEVTQTSIEMLTLETHDVQRLRAWKNRHLGFQHSDPADDRLPERPRLERWAARVVGAALEVHPIYTIPVDTRKGRLRRAAIQSVRIEDGAIVATLAPWARVLTLFHS